MKEIVVATTNKGKLKEISAMLEKLGIEVKSIKDVLGYNPDIEETGTTFTENAVIKAETVIPQPQGIFPRLVEEKAA